MSRPPPEDNYVGEPGYPSPWTTKKPREGLRDNHEARIVSLSPDVCKTPVGSATPPIPYPVVDFCDHDENYTPSVRFTSQKAMVLRSNTSHVHGDQPGVATGIKSGTVGARCHPIGHAAQVRAEGSPVIRHLDRCHMNDRNTVGEAIFARSMKPYEAPEDDDPIPGSLRSAPPGQQNMSNASPEPWIANARYAGARPAAAPQPSTVPRPAPTRPPSSPGGTVIRPNVPQWKMPPPTELPKGSFPSRLGRWAIPFGKKFLKGPWPLAALWPSELADGTLPEWYHDPNTNDPRRRAVIDEAQRRYLDRRELRKLLEEWYKNEVQDLPTQPQTQPEAQNKPEDDLDGASVPVPAPDNVRVNRERKQCPCLVGTYDQIKTACSLTGCEGQAHHIIPDFTKRYGTRDEGIAHKKRVPGMPSFGMGASICLNGMAANEYTEHNEAHGADLAIESLGHGKSHYPAGTAPIGEIVRTSLPPLLAMKATDPGCAQKIMAAVSAEMRGVNTNLLGRTTVGRPPEVNSDAYKALSSGMTATRH